MRLLEKSVVFLIQNRGKNASQSDETFSQMLLLYRGLCNSSGRFINSVKIDDSKESDIEKRDDIEKIENLLPHHDSLNKLFYQFYEFLYHDL